MEKLDFLLKELEVAINLVNDKQIIPEFKPIIQDRINEINEEIIKIIDNEYDR